MKPDDQIIIYATADGNASIDVERLKNPDGRADYFDEMMVERQ